MSLSIGDRIGRFQVLGCLGVGGMGEVYRARDPQLEREVAIKVLPSAFSSDPDRQRRFEQEARAAGALNHPNILAVHDVGVQDGATWIVTELLVGETLRQRMDGRPLSPRTVVDYAIQIASGLAAAHERGIVHRDIKPANLFITKDGRVKILDFGLAKLSGTDGQSDTTETLTIGENKIAPVAGTAMYMSPEQVRGLRTDHRSDIFSLGTVMFEMLAGFPPFRRSCTADTLAAIVNEDPPAPLAPPALTPPVSSAIERLVRHCLEKEPGARFQSARDLVFDLENLPTTTTAHAAAGAPRRKTARRAAIVVAGLLGLSSVALLGYLAGRRAVPPNRTPIHSVRRVTDLAGLEEFPSISPDRRSVAFTADVDGRRQVFVRLLASGPPLQITKDPVDHRFPRWSTDASSLLYFSPANAGDPQGAI
jgi:eukaryotic-like serine/threonine-protein kinase